MALAIVKKTRVDKPGLFIFFVDSLAGKIRRIYDTIEGRRRFA